VREKIHVYASYIFKAELASGGRGLDRDFIAIRHQVRAKRNGHIAHRGHDVR
jgi:hypothetical protein